MGTFSYNTITTIHYNEGFFIELDNDIEYAIKDI